MESYFIQDCGIARNIVRLRKAAGMTQSYVSIQLQTMGVPISRSRLSMIELGRLNIPVQMLVALKVLFRCEYAAFFEGLEQKLLDELAHY